MSSRARAIGLALLGMAFAACPRAQEHQDGKRALVLLHQPLWGDPAPFAQLLDQFRATHPELELRTQLLPNDSDVAHQFLLTALEGRSTDFDVLVVDVVWVAEFARAGWIADLTPYRAQFAMEDDFLEGPLTAATFQNRLYAVPWYVDVGLLFYRTDLVPRAPRTYDELRAFAQSAQREHPGMHGYVWQGRQYEGLVCNVYEAIWGHGGQSMEDGRLALATPEAIAGLGYLRALLESGVSPPSVTAAAEEEVRRSFQAGRAVFMRNWPYAYREAQREDSPIRGKVGFAPLPSVGGEPGWGTLGGWQLAINAHIPPGRRDNAAQLVAHLTSTHANRVLAVAYGRNPARGSVYGDSEIKRAAPFIAALLPALERARPRPVTPYYNLLSDVLQGEFSAAITGVRSPKASLERAQRWADHLTQGAEQ